MLDIYELQIFLSAAETGSFSEAGRRLQLSQPAVSMQIRSLEKRIGVELFSRAGRNITLTEVGQALIPMARDLVNMSIRTEETIASLKGEIFGVLKLSCSTTAGKYALPKLIASFVDQYPQVQVVCEVCPRRTAIKNLLEGRSQIAISSLMEPYRELEYQPFIVDPVVLIVPPQHPWAGRASITVDELSKGRFIVREQNSGTQETVVDALMARDLSFSELDVVMILGNSEAITMAVAEGIGVAFVSRRASAESILTQHVVEVPVEDLSIRQQLYMVRHTQYATTSAQAAFWEHVYTPENRALLTDDCFQAFL